MSPSDSALFEHCRTHSRSLSKSKSPPGDSPTPARASANSFRPPPPPRSKRNSATPPKCNRLTGATPTLALHVLWDLPNGLADVERFRHSSSRSGIRAGSINPNLFQDQEYKFGSLCNPSAEIRGKRAAATFSTPSRSPRHLRCARHLPLACRRLQLSRHAEHPPPHRVA